MNLWGYGLKLADTIASWVLSEDGYTEWALRRYAKKVETNAIRALQAKDFAAVDEHVATLKRMSTEA